MNKEIIVSFPAGMVKEQRTQVTAQVTKTLETISYEVSSWNGFVDFIQTPFGDYTLVAQCNNDEIRKKMQALINAAIATIY